MYKTVIIIPFRDRDEHLNEFIRIAVPLIYKYLPNSKIVVVEQNNDKLFNRGALLNVGFKEYENKTEYFITNDVDMIPSDNVVRDVYSQEYKNVIRIRSAHKQSLGGVVKFKHSAIFDINGFPNNIWGWGIEDRALFYRCYIKNIYVTDDMDKNVGDTKRTVVFGLKSVGDSRRSLKYNQFQILPHKSNENMNYIGDKKILSDLWTKVSIDKLDTQHKLELIMESGISNLNYTIIERQNIHDMVEKIKVDF